MKTLLLIVTLFASVHSFAQDTKEVETFFGNNFESTGYGALSTQYSTFNGKGAAFLGAYGGWMINHKFMLGVGAYGLLTHPDGYNAAGEADNNNEFQMGYGGVMMEYTFASSKRIHLSTNLLIGGGRVSNGYYTSRGYLYGSQWHVQDESAFYVFQPSVNVEMNMTSWFRVALGGGYRHINGSHMIGISDKSMSAPTANLTFKFGLF
jgi:hypothetical protein